MISKNKNDSFSSTDLERFLQLKKFQQNNTQEELLNSTTPINEYSSPKENKITAFYKNKSNFPFI